MKLVSKGLLITVLAALFFIPAQVGMAAGAIDLTVTPSVTTANVGDEVTFTITMGSATGTDLERFSLTLSIPDGLDYVRGSGNVPRSFTNGILDYIDSTGVNGAGWMAIFDDEFGTGAGATPRPQDFLLISGFGDPYNGNKTLVMAEFNCIVKKPGQHVITLKNLDFAGNGEIIDTPKAIYGTLNVAGGKGDVNNDGVINYDDVTLALNHYLGTDALESSRIWAADVDNDGKISFFDVMAILNHYFGAKLIQG